MDYWPEILLNTNLNCQIWKYFVSKKTFFQQAAIVMIKTHHTHLKTDSEMKL